MLKRILTTLVAVPILIYVLWQAPAYVFVICVALAVVLGIREFQLMAGKIGWQGQQWIGWLGGLLVLFGFWQGELAYSVLALTIVLALAMIVYMIERLPLQAALFSTSTTVAGVVYVGLFMGYLVSLRCLEGDIPSLSAKLLSFFFFVVWAGDSMAMLAGRWLGKHKLLPLISPNKTVEGGIGGLLGSVVAAALAKFWFFPELDLAQALILGGGMGIMGQVGDWCESMLKRGAKLEDTASLLPGHGGILDRLDSMLFNAPILYYYYRLFLT